MNIINLTPHSIKIQLPDDSVLVIPATAPAARLSTKSIQLPAINGIPVVETEFGQVENLPEQKRDTVLIVPTIIAQRLSSVRSDLLSPDTGPTAIRENGQVIAVRALQSF